MQLIMVNDPLEKTEFEGQIRDCVELAEGAELLSVTIPEFGTISIIRHADGKLFSTSDWQGMQPTTAEDIEDYNWIDLSNGITAVMLNGLPRTLLGN